MYRLLSFKKDWQVTLNVSLDVKNDLVWWLKALDHWNRKVLKASAPDWVTLETDESLEGWRSRLADGDGRQKYAQGFWNSGMGQKHSNEGESIAVLLSLKTFVKDLSGKSVWIHKYSGRSESKPHKISYQHLILHGPKSDTGKSNAFERKKELRCRSAIPLFEQIRMDDTPAIRANTNG